MYQLLADNRKSAILAIFQYRYMPIILTDPDGSVFTKSRSKIDQTSAFECQFHVEFMEI